MKFNFIAKTKIGKDASGTIEAFDLLEAKNILLGRKLIITSITPLKELPMRWLSPSFFGKVSLLEKVIFAKHLSLMIKGGLPLRESIVVIKEQSKNRKFKRALDDILASINSGRSLSYALSFHPGIFDGFYVNMIKMGEETGVLEGNLKSLADQLEKNYELRKKITAAMVYPGIIFSSVIVLGSSITFFILPKITDVFKDFRITLPLPTRILISLVDIAKDYGLFILGGTFFLFLTLSFIYRIRVVKSFFHRNVLKLPLFGSINKNMSLVYFNRNLGILLKSGAPLMSALGVVRTTLSNITYQKEIEKIIERVRGGKPISEYLKEKEKLFPSMISRMINVGEKTGNLEEILLYLGDFYEIEVDRAVKILSTILEPIILLIIGLVIGFVAMAIITPIYEVTGSLHP